MAPRRWREAQGFIASMVLEADGQPRWQKSGTEGHGLHYKTGVRTRRAVARVLGKRIIDNAGQSPPVLLCGASKPWYFTSGPGVAVSDASMCSAVNILTVATPARGAWSSPSVFICVHHCAWWGMH